MAHEDSDEFFRHPGDRIERAREASEAHLRQIFDSSLDGISVNAWAGGEYVDVNPEFERLTGYSRDEILGKKPSALRTWLDRVAYRDMLGLMERDGMIRDYEAELRRKDGTATWVLFSALKVDLGGEPCVVGFTRDISGLKRAQTALRESEERYRSLVESSPDGVCVHAGGRILYVNSAFVTMLGGSSPDVFLGHDPMEFVEPEYRGRVVERIREVQQERKPTVLFREKLSKTGGGRVDVEVLSTPIVYDGKRAVQALVRDVTEKLLAEEELVRTRDAALEASRLKTAFLANMSHEIRTPLNVILGLSSLISEHLKEAGDDSQAVHFDGIRRASRRLLGTIHGILDLSKIEAHAFDVRSTLVDLRMLVEQQVEDFKPLAEARGIRLRTRIELESAVALFDEYCLSQALSNLLDNAIKFTQRGEVSVRLYRDRGDALVVEVCDTGIGIDEAFLSRLGEPFLQEDAGYTRRFEGTGLGLTLAKSYLELNGATLTVESRKGEGSKFRIRLGPGQGAGSRGQGAASRNDEGTREMLPEKTTVLLVEDDEDSQLYMCRLLGKRYGVLCAASGEEFRQRLTEGGTKISMVLMDLSLRGSEDGLTLTRWLRNQERWRDVPVIAVTAHAFAKDRENALRGGCDEFVAKPIDSRELFAKMDQMSHRTSAAPQG